jgi:hypothetical protein
MLDSTAKMQHNISVMLEAKAVEAEKSRKWINQHIHPSYFEEDHESQVKLSLEFHEQVVDLLSGMTKLEMGLARNLRIILGHEGNEQPAFGGGFFDMGGNGQ